MSCQLLIDHTNKMTLCARIVGNLVPASDILLDPREGFLMDPKDREMMDPHTSDGFYNSLWLGNKKAFARFFQLPNWRD